MVQAGQCPRRTTRAVGVSLVALAILGVGILLVARVPQIAAGMAAKSMCSAAFVAGRPWRDLMAQDVLPASPVLRAIDVSVDEAGHSVTARFLGLFPRRAVLLPDRGCVLDAPPDPSAHPYEPSADTANTPWPRGDVGLAPGEWGDGVDAARLIRIADSAFEGTGDPRAANARGLAVVHRGRLLLLRNAPGFAPGTGLHGWSMAKTVTGMLTHKLAAETGLSLEAPVVDAFLPEREPEWVADWRKDARGNIKVSDLLYMRDGLAGTEDYAPWGSVPRMLWGAPDMAAWAAGHPAEAAPGERWRYRSATANLLAAVARGRFDSDQAYWAYPGQALFQPIGARSATMETDLDGNWVASSYVWASVGDWARLGLLMLQDGRWGDRQVLPAGWLQRAATPATATGEGFGYGAQTWLFGHREAGHDCRDQPGVPVDTVAMSGHWGQMVAMVPSRNVVVVRMGWTVQPDAFDDCTLLSDVLSALPAGME